MNRITKILNALIDILRLHPKHSFVIFHSSSCIGEYMLPYTDKDMTLEELKIALRDEQDVLVEVIVH